MIVIHRLARPAAAALLLAAAGSPPAWADISLAVGAGGQEAEATFGAGVTRVHGRANDTTAYVDTGGSPCATPGVCTIVNSETITNADFDAERVRWRVDGFATGANNGTSAQILVTDFLSFTGTPNTLAMVDFSIRIEIDSISATPFSNGGIGADAWYSFELGSFSAGEGPPQFQPFFTLQAEEHHYAGFPAQRIFMAPGMSGSEIPTAYETTFSMPLFLGPSGLGTLDLALRSSAETAVQNGSAAVRSFNSAYLGLSATGATFTSANGYGYRGFAVTPVPEPPMALLALAGLGVLVARRRLRAG